MRRSDVTKKKRKRVCCDFCGKSSGNRYETRQHKQEPDESLESKLKRLGLLTRRMTGKDLYGLSFPELQSLETHLSEAKLTVRNQKEKMLEAERLLKQKREAGDKDKAGLLAPRSSSGEEQDDEAPPPKSQRHIEYKRRKKAESYERRKAESYERQKAESMESEVERLWLLKERMSGRELDNMNIEELCQLEYQMNLGLLRMCSGVSDLFYLLSV